MSDAPLHLIVGAKGGVGRALALHLHAQGARVALAARETEPLAELAATCGGAPCFALDARDFEAVSGLFAAVRAECGRLDGVANVVGSLLLRPAHSTSQAQWDEVLSTNLGSAFACVRAAGGAALLGEGPSALVLVSSAAAQVGLPQHEAIAAAKAGIEGLTRSAAATYASAGLRVNAVSPGLTKTPLTQRLWASEAAAAASAAMHPLGRLGEPEEVAAAIAFLLTQPWITGQVLGVDGGLATLRPKQRTSLTR